VTLEEKDVKNNAEEKNEVLKKQVDNLTSYCVQLQKQTCLQELLLSKIIQKIAGGALMSEEMPLV
jgi:hypothetical protein